MSEEEEPTMLGLQYDVYRDSSGSITGACSCPTQCDACWVLLVIRTMRQRNLWQQVFFFLLFFKHWIEILVAFSPCECWCGWRNNLLDVFILSEASGELKGKNAKAASMSFSHFWETVSEEYPKSSTRALLEQLIWATWSHIFKPVYGQNK